MKTSSWISAAGAWALVALLFILPYGNLLSADICVTIPLTVAGALWASFCAHKRRHLSQYVPSGFLLLGCFVTYFVATLVSFRNDMVECAVEGQVVESSRSNNHQYPELHIKNADGTVSVLTGIFEELFKMVKVEDRFSKAAGATTARVNDQPMEVVCSSFLDLIRQRNH